MTEKEIDRLSVEQVRTQKNLDALVERVGALTQGLDDLRSDMLPRRPKNWLTVRDVTVARAWLHELKEWVDRELRAYHPDLPACWWLHPAAVNDLLALHRTYLDAYAPDAISRAASDLHATWLPTFVGRMKGVVPWSMEHCGEDHVLNLFDYKHQEMTLTPFAVNQRRMDDHVQHYIENGLLIPESSPALTRRD